MEERSPAWRRAILHEVPGAGAGSRGRELVEGGGPDSVAGDVGEQVEPGERSEGEPLRGVGNEVAVDVANRGRTWKVRARVPVKSVKLF